MEKKTKSQAMMGNKRASKEYKPPAHVRRAQIINRLSALIVELAVELEKEGLFEWPLTPPKNTK